MLVVEVLTHPLPTVLYVGASHKAVPASCCGPSSNAWTRSANPERSSKYSSVVRAKWKTMSLLKLNDTIEDILITLGKQYHIIRLMASKPGLFLYIVLDKNRSNLAMARRKVQDIEGKIVI